MRRRKKVTKTSRNVHVGCVGHTIHKTTRDEKRRMKKKNKNIFMKLKLWVTYADDVVFLKQKKQELWANFCSYLILTQLKLGAIYLCHISLETIWIIYIFFSLVGEFRLIPIILCPFFLFQHRFSPLLCAFAHTLGQNICSICYLSFI